MLPTLAYQLKAEMMCGTVDAEKIVLIITFWHVLYDDRVGRTNFSFNNFIFLEYRNIIKWLKTYKNIINSD